VKGQDPTGEVTELLQQLIRNECVNDGTPSSGNEIRSVETLEAFFAGCGAPMQRYEPLPGRGNLVLRVEGSDRSAPTFCLMGHIDVVPVNPAGWTRDPFGGELVDGTVWGRGAIDMLSITASMAVATKRLLRDGWRPRGTLLYLAVADEEALGTYGAQWLVEHAWDAVRCDMLVTEFGGARIRLGTKPKLPIMVGEKGSHWTRLRARGTPGHGSMPYKTDNAVVTMAEVARRIASYKPPTTVDRTWRAFIDGLDLPRVQRTALKSARGLDRALGRMPVGVARMLHAATHTTFSPNILHGGSKTNIVPDRAELVIDIRTLPGVDGAAVHRMLKDAIGDLWPSVEIAEEGDNLATSSEIDTELWRALTRVTERLVPGAHTLPFLVVGATDARFFRRKGVTSYGYGLFSEKIPFEQFATMFHGNDERIDQASLRLMVDLWDGAARELLG
jgi:acetylornithine deacetylase/succinyl-diaminopimelate desuccinylase-like protein